MNDNNSKGYDNNGYDNNKKDTEDVTDRTTDTSANNNTDRHTNEQAEKNYDSDNSKLYETSEVKQSDAMDNDDMDIDDILMDIDDEDDRPVKKAKRPKTAGDFVRYFIIAVAAAVFCYSSFMLIKIYLEYKQGDDIYKSISNSVFKPAEHPSGSDEGETEGQLPFVYDHNALLQINPEGIGYLYIPSIDLRLPMVQGPDNDYYLTHTFNRTYNGAGALFEDSRIDNGLKATNVIIYGHNMRNGSMFAGLNKYLTPSFYNEPGNDLFYIYTENVVKTYRIFSAYISEPISSTYTYNFTTQELLRDYAAEMKGLSAYNTNVNISDTKQVVTFSTCTADGSQRIIVHGTYIGETPLSN